jgi:hypothetical protein
MWTTDWHGWYGLVNKWPLLKIGCLILIWTYLLMTLGKCRVDQDDGGAMVWVLDFVGSSLAWTTTVSNHPWARYYTILLWNGYQTELGSQPVMDQHLIQGVRPYFFQNGVPIVFSNASKISHRRGKCVTWCGLPSSEMELLGHRMVHSHSVCKPIINAERAIAACTHDSLLA